MYFTRQLPYLCRSPPPLLCRLTRIPPVVNEYEVIDPRVRKQTAAKHGASRYRPCLQIHKYTDIQTNVNSVEEIPGIIRSLCQGSAEEQEETIKAVFLPDAAFQHPLCRVPSLSWKLRALPLHEINSRLLIMAIYRWYRLLSPKIELQIHSTSMLS